jgi:nucleoside-diphosphate-sugar epimerase
MQNINSTVMVTGANGFVGQALCTELRLRQYRVRATVRMASQSVNEIYSNIHVGEINGSTEWSKAVEGANVVVHTAARVHVMAEKARDPIADFRRVNVLGTLNLANQAAQAGVRRFVYISSIKAIGEFTEPLRPFTEVSPTLPLDAYGLSKLEAEQGLRELAAQTGLEVVIIRPPLVYGPGVRANFAALFRAVQRGIPLPLRAVHNARSLVGLDNLVDFIVTCSSHKSAANQTFLISDAHDLSTSELIRGMAQSAGVEAHLFPAPVWALKAAARMMGKGDTMQRLCGNLQVDISKARTLLNWEPPVTVFEGLRRAIAGVNES